MQGKVEICGVNTATLPVLKSAEMRSLLEEAIGRLSPRERHILSLRFCDGRTQMEVARQVGISQAQVSRLEKGAIGRIKKELSA